MEIRAASIYSGSHADDVDHVSLNPTHPELFVSSSQKDRKIVFWDARRALHNSRISCFSNFIPTRKSFYPTAFPETHTNTDRICARRKDNILRFCWTFVIFSRAGEEPRGNQGYMEDCGGGENGKKTRHILASLTKHSQVVASSALFNHAGDGIVASFHSEHTLRVFDYPALTIQENPAAHVGGCIAIAQDPRGKYIASGGHDSIVNLFDVTEWICARTITCCE